MVVVTFFYRANQQECAAAMRPAGCDCNTRTRWLQSLSKRQMPLGAGCLGGQKQNGHASVPRLAMSKAHPSRLCPGRATPLQTAVLRLGTVATLALPNGRQVTPNRCEVRATSIDSLSPIVGD